MYTLLYNIIIMHDVIAIGLQKLIDDYAMDLFLVFSVTMRSTEADGDSMDHFLVFSITMRSVVADGDSTLKSIYQLQM